MPWRASSRHRPRPRPPCPARLPRPPPTDAGLSPRGGPGRMRAPCPSCPTSSSTSSASRRASRGSRSSACGSGARSSCAPWSRPSRPPRARVTGLSRLGKRLVIGLERELYLVLHLMIAGRLRWRPPRGRIPARRGIAALDFPTGTLLVTEAGTRKRASLHLVEGAQALAALDPGGVEVLEADLPRFRTALVRESHTLKRALTDPRLLSGIGNAYSDEILHRARLSPLRLTRQLDDRGRARPHAPGPAAPRQGTG